MKKRERQEKYIERNDLRDATHLEISVYYTKGGANYFSGGTTPRGFYISVTPVTKSNGMISFTMFTGRKQLLFTTNRYTDKQLARAVEMAKDYEAELISVVVAENKAA